MFDRGDMVSQQQDANRQAADHQKAAEKAFREAQAQARADVIVYFRDKPLAHFEQWVMKLFGKSIDELYALPKQ